MAARAHASGSAQGTAVVCQKLAAAPADLPVLDGRTDTVPDIVGRLGAPIGLAIFTEGNHFPALLGGEIIEPFRAWAQAQVQYAELALDNIVVVTLPQPMIIQMLLRGGLTLGNLTIEVSRVSGFYPDIVIGGCGAVDPATRGFARRSQRDRFCPKPGALCARSQPKPFRNTFSASLARFIRATDLQC